MLNEHLGTHPEPTGEGHDSKVWMRRGDARGAGVGIFMMENLIYSPRKTISITYTNQEIDI